MSPITARLRESRSLLLSLLPFLHSTCCHSYHYNIQPPAALVGARTGERVRLRARLGALGVSGGLAGQRVERWHRTSRSSAVGRWPSRKRRRSTVREVRRLEGETHEGELGEAKGASRLAQV
jgi:hypothetical protein